MLSTMSALTFVTFLPARFQSIEEEVGEYGSDSESQSSIQSEPYGGGASTSQPAMRKLQFSDVGTSTHSKPVELKNLQENRGAILQAEPYYFLNKPLMLQQWELNFEFNHDCITTIPLWVTFPGLPVGCWSSEALSKVSSAIEKLGMLSTYVSEASIVH
ncbi:hypothetical protein KY285_023595 [Solanum tuberosum]|nr:hypothetical protein KY289_023927 [Solanum tuberosum]KAH0675794.1 hypothetical protein KY285_023595 [Solanum tuberosum]